jgi:hypothetical protein
MTSSPNIIINVNDKNRQLRMGFSNPDRRCKTSSFKKATTKYIEDMIDYYSNPDKAPISFDDFLNDTLESLETANLIVGYDKTEKKSIYAKKEDIAKIKKQNLKYIEHSNLNQLVFSFNNSFINENIEISKLHDIMTKKILPDFFESIGYDSKKISYQLSFHTDTDNFHYHLSFMEKEPAYKSRWKNAFQYRRKLNIDQEILNSCTRSIQLQIEKERYYNPLIKNIDDELSNIKKELKRKDKNYVLENAKHFRVEAKLLKLGKLLNDERVKNGYSNNYKMKFGSIKNKEIRDLTKELNKQFLSSSFDSELKSSFKESIDIFNAYLKKINEDNFIPSTNIDNRIIEKKEKELDNFILNQIVNTSLYEYRKEEYRNKNKTSFFIQELAYQNYRETKFKKRIQVLHNYVRKKNEYFIKNDTYNNFSPYNNSCMPNLNSIKYKLNQLSQKRKFEIKKIQEEQKINWYDKTNY